MRIEQFEEIISWQKAKELSISVYTIFEQSCASLLEIRYSELQYQL